MHISGTATFDIISFLALICSSAYAWLQIRLRKDYDVSIIPFADNTYSTMAILVAFTVSHTMIFIVLYSRMFEALGENKVPIIGAIAAFKDVGYALDPLIAGFLVSFISFNTTFLLMGVAFILLVPVALNLHD